MRLLHYTRAPPFLGLLVVRSMSVYHGLEDTLVQRYCLTSTFEDGKGNFKRNCMI